MHPDKLPRPPSTQKAAFGSIMQIWELARNGTVWIDRDSYLIWPAWRDVNYSLGGRPKTANETIMVWFGVGVPNWGDCANMP